MNKVMRSKKVLLLMTTAIIFLVALPARPNGEKLWTELKNPGGLSPDAPLRLSSFRKLAKKLSPSVVNIKTIKSVNMGSGGFFRHFGGRRFFKDPFFDMYKRFFKSPRRRFKNRGLGTGVIINKKGYILTNQHVIAKADKIIVSLSTHKEVRGKVIGADPKTDLALIKIDTNQDLPVAPLGDSDKLQIGDWVVAIGNPFGLDHTVTAGIVSAKGRKNINPGRREGYYADFIQTDASINPGNSGGPLINIRGEVIGINTAINRAGQGIGFAIPINMAKTLLPQLRYGKVRRSWIGVHIQPVTPHLARSFGLTNPRGALIADVIAGSPADKAGLMAGDLILKFNGTRIMSSSDLPWLASTAGIGKKIYLTIKRQGRIMTVPLVLAEFPEDGKVALRTSRGSQDRASGLGLQVGNITQRLLRKLKLGKRRGVVVLEVKSGSEAEEAGIKVRDVIIKVNFKRIRNTKDFTKIIRSLKKGRAVNFYLRRGKGHIWIALVKK